MNNIFLIMLGGGLGSLLRYGVGLWSTNLFHTKFPAGTLLVNTLGSLLIGVLWGLSNQGTWNDTVKAFVFIGLLGGFTTFSSFSLDTLKLFETNQSGAALLNIAANNILSIGFCYAGYLLCNQGN